MSNLLLLLFPFQAISTGRFTTLALCKIPSKPPAFMYRASA